MDEPPEIPPPVLYRYMDAATAYKTIQDSTLSFTPPVRFNDPFDTNVVVDLPRGHYVMGGISTTPEEIKVSFERASERVLGVACFSTHVNDPLMWAHYADKHRGVVLGYSTDHPDLKGRFRKVKYLKERPSFEEKIDESFVRKSPIWEYEDEWRILKRLSKCQVILAGATPIYLHRIGADAIVEVRFGCRTAKDIMYGIDHILLGKYPKLRPTLNLLDPKEYELVVKDFRAESW